MPYVSVVIVYVLTGVLGVIIALLLAYWARSMSPASIERRRRERENRPADVPSAGFLREAIADELGGLVESRQRCQEVADKVSGILDREFERKLNKTTQELAEKYENVIKEKAKNEEMAWGKYNKVLGEKQETEAVIRSIAEGLLVVDSQGNVVMMNPAAEKLLGVSKKDKIGKPVAQDLKGEQLVSLIRSGPESEAKEIELMSSQDDTKKILKASSAVIENEYGQTVGMVSVLSDVTKQRELDRLKSSFIASVSHELRTPLVAIEKSVSLMLNRETGDITPTQEQFLSIADRNLKRLTRLINDLLDMSKLEAGKMELKAEPSSLEKAINDSVEGLLSWANTKSVNIERKIAREIPQVNMDSDRIIQVLTNLIGNAIKFVPKSGQIVVEAKLATAGSEVEVSVQDNGIGISPENLPRVFDKFYQVGERASQDISGTGIGLSISREIVELHGGKIRAESEKGRGARFTFTLPLR